MLLSNIRIVLVETSHPGNIGSTARAMKTMGLTELYLVNPKHFPDKRANELASRADSVLEAATVCSTLQEALLGVELVIGTSARPRGIGLLPLSPREAATKVLSYPDNTTVAIVFGREDSGLSNDELLLCNYHLNIPSASDYSSLNLSQAVQIVAYELRMALLNPMPYTELRADTLATHDEVELFFEHLERVLLEVDFLKPSNPRRLMPRLRRMFNRIQLETMEVNILRGMLKHVLSTIHLHQGETKK